MNASERGGRLRRPLVAGNWKMNGLRAESLGLASSLARLPAGRTVDVVLCPPFTALSAVGEAIRGTGLDLGAQNLHWEDAGAFTGEIAGPMLRELGCAYVIVGHSERRQYFGETDETVRRRLAAAARHSLRPILCVGETLKERETGSTEETVDAQLRAALGGEGPAGASGLPPGLTVAYEPVWAIGTGRAARGADAERVAKFIRGLLADLFGAQLAAEIRVLYGGSVKPDNIADFACRPDVDGALVGGASLKADDFAAIVEQFAR